MHLASQGFFSYAFQRSLTNKKSKSPILKDLSHFFQGVRVCRFRLVPTKSRSEKLPVTRRSANVLHQHARYTGAKLGERLRFRVPVQYDEKLVKNSRKKPKPTWPPENRSSQKENSSSNHGFSMAIFVPGRVN